MGIRTIMRSYQTLCYEALECGRVLPSPAERMAILLDASATTGSGTALSSASTKVDVLAKEVKQLVGYGRRRIGRIVTAIASGTFTSVGHGLADGNVVFVAGINPGTTFTPPSPTVLGTPYYVISSTSDTFRLAATPGGTFLSVTSLPAGITMIVGSGVYDEVDRRHESITETVRFTGTGTTGYVYGGFAVVRGGHAQANIIVNNFNAASDQVTITSGHQMVNGDEVFFVAGASSTVPPGIVERQIYFIRSASTTVLTLHNTRADAIAGTSLVDITAAAGGDGTVWMHYANGEVESFEAFTSTSTLANGEEQPFALNGFFSNSGNAIGLV